MKLLLTFFFIFTAFPSWALTCRNDYAGSAGCAGNSSAAGNCETLGFSTADEPNCKHYLYCPFDLSYKRCVAIGIDCSDYPLTSCPAAASKCEECGDSGEIKYKVITCKTGYTLANDTCEAADCPLGYSTSYQSISDCGSSGSQGWTYSSNGYSASKRCGKCTAKACLSGTSLNYTNINNCPNGSEGWDSVSITAYSADRPCYQCKAKACDGYSATVNCDTSDNRCLICYSGTELRKKKVTCSELNAMAGTCVYTASCPDRCYRKGETQSNVLTCQAVDALGICAEPGSGGMAN